MTTAVSTEPIGYMERTRIYYRALGYKSDYIWSTFDDVPFARLSKPLAEARLGVVTTSLPPDLVDTNAIGGKQLWSRATRDMPERMATDHLAWDKESTHTRDRESFLPINRLGELVANGVIGGLSARVHGVPTVYSQRQTIEKDAPEIWRRIKEDGADAVMLVPL